MEEIPISSEAIVTTDPPQTPTSIWNRNFIILFFANMAFNMGLNMSNSLLPLYASSIGASAATIGLVMSSFGVSSILFRMISAPVMDTYNRKNLVIFAAALLSVAFFGYSLSTNIPMLVGSRLVHGCALAFGNACCLAMVAEMLPKDKYNTGLGYYSLAQVICSALGPSVGLALVDLAGFRVTYTIAASVTLLAAFLACLIKASFTRTKKLKLTFNNIVAREALLPATFHLLMTFAGAGTSAFLYLFAKEQGVTGNVGLYFTVSAVTMLATRPLVGRLTDKYGLVKVSIPAVCCSALALIIVSRSTTLAGLLSAAFVAAFGQGAFTPAIQALTMKSVPNDRRGAASTTNFIAQDIGSMVGAVVGGYIVKTLGYIPLYRIMMIPFLAGGLMLFLFRSTILRIEEEFAAR